MQYLEMIELQRSIMILTPEDEADTDAESNILRPSVFAQADVRTRQAA
jgi:hypothetical protein